MIHRRAWIVGRRDCGWPAAGRPADAKPKAPAGVAVEFTGCVESIGVGLVPTERVQALVPPEFHVVGEGGPVTPLVVRTADCDGIAVDGHHPKAGSVVQIGVVIVPPDFSGDINNYTLAYYTSDAKLAHALQGLGVSAQHVPTMAYVVTGGDPASLYVALRRPAREPLSLDGTVVPSEVAAGSFEAIWWVKVGGESVRMDTFVPEIFIGSADLTLTTHPTSQLGHLIGGSTTGFPILQQFNTFATAPMDVRVVAP